MKHCINNMVCYLCKILVKIELELHALNTFTTEYKIKRMIHQQFKIDKNEQFKNGNSPNAILRNIYNHNCKCPK